MGLLIEHLQPGPCFSKGSAVSSTFLFNIFLKYLIFKCACCMYRCLSSLEEGITSSGTVMRDSCKLGTELLSLCIRNCSAKLPPALASALNSFRLMARARASFTVLGASCGRRLTYLSIWGPGVTFSGRVFLKCCGRIHRVKIKIRLFYWLRISFMHFYNFIYYYRM